MSFVEILLGVRSFELCNKFMIMLGDFLAMAEWPISVQFGS